MGLRKLDVRRRRGASGYPYEVSRLGVVADGEAVDVRRDGAALAPQPPGRQGISDVGILVKYRYSFAMSKQNSLTEQSQFQALLRQIRVDGGLRQTDLAERLGQP